MKEIHTRPPIWAWELARACGSEDKAKVLATRAWYEEQRRLAEALKPAR